MKKGFSIAALVATVTIMVILISVATISANNMSKNTKASNFAVEINSIEQAVNSYIQSNPNDYPILNSVTIDVSTIGDANKVQFTNNGDTISNNQITLFEIDYNKINYGNLKYGTKKDGTNDVYLFSTVTNKVYYAKGFKVGNKAYYTLTDELKKKISYKTTESLVEDSKTTISSTQEIKQDKTNEGYAKEGLILHYDAINNTGNGFDSKATSWKDLSGNGNDGILYNFTNTQESGWKDNSLKFNNDNDHVDTGLYAATTFTPRDSHTLEAVFKLNKVTNIGSSYQDIDESYILGAASYGGYGLVWQTYDDSGAYNLTAFHRCGQGSIVSASKAMTSNNLQEKMVATQVYDTKNNVIILYINGNYTNSMAIPSYYYPNE